MEYNDWRGFGFGFSPRRVAIQEKRIFYLNVLLVWEGIFSEGCVLRTILQVKFKPPPRIQS